MHCASIVVAKANTVMPDELYKYCSSVLIQYHLATANSLSYVLVSDIF